MTPAPSDPPAPTKLDRVDVSAGASIAQPIDAAFEAAQAVAGATAGAGRSAAGGAFDQGHDDDGDHGDDQGPDDVGHAERTEQDDRGRGTERDDDVQHPALRVHPVAGPAGGHLVLFGAAP